MTTSTEMPKAYDPRDVETRWYRFWETQGLFRASDAPNDTRETYTISIPPPNVTGSLHMGHACRTTFEDVLIRYHRMLGRNTLWLPGTDHAGIATQVVVERQLRAQGKTRYDLGREAFIKRVWEWKAESGGRILQQLRILGASCDWSRERFTMDEGLSRAVQEVFLQLYREKLIYRATRMISWCVRCHTALSDLEVESQENVKGELFDFAYPVEGGGEIVVSTTRAETMLGDTAIAVHPDDPRYQHLHGRFVVHPFTKRKVPIIADALLVDMAFGTGAVKVTPAHDPSDFATGKRHNLEEINLLNQDGTLNENAGEFQGMDRIVAREAVKAKLTELGLVRGQKEYLMTIPHCQRCNTIVEPMISTQWFVKMEPLARPAIEAVEKGKTKIIPEQWTKTYFHWMNNIQDWCISRQLWWGHPIPAFYCDKAGHVNVSVKQPDQCFECDATSFERDPDVLDTWFSSALWPFSTLGWPDNTTDLARFYPTSDMETGYDILFFWVARMMMMGIHFMGDVPFRRVLLSGMVTDERGQKMSKVKGNVIDPLDVIQGATLDQLTEKAQKSGASKSGIDYLRKTYPEGFATCGADALRCTLLSYSPQTPKIALSIKRIEGYRNFCNKLWNAARYALMNLQESGAKAGGGRPEPKQFANRWILSRLGEAILSARKGVDEYRLDDALNALYHFIWHEFCDWYLELSKPLMANVNDKATVEETQATLVHALETALRLLHPMTPFITEEIWQRIPKSDNSPSSIMVARYPQFEVDALTDKVAEQEMELLQQVIVATRTIRSEHDVPPRKVLPLALLSPNRQALDILERERNAIVTLCCAELSVELKDHPETPDNAAVAAVGDVTVLVPLASLIDRDKEKERVERKLKKTIQELEAITKKLNNPEFVSRAPQEVVSRERERKTELERAKQQLETGLAQLL
jgi:valyl-tRNA synthetase